MVSTLRRVIREHGLSDAVNRSAALALCCALVGGCGSEGGSSSSDRGSGSAQVHARFNAMPHSPALGPRVCGAAPRAATASLRVRVRMQVADTDPAYLECLLDARGIHVDIVAQAIAQALGDYDTTLVHQVQTYVEPPGPGGVRDRTQLPHPIPGIGTKAAWILGQHKLLATNGTPDRGGNFMSVTVTGRPTSGFSSLALARAIAEATLAVAPRRPNLRSEH